MNDNERARIIADEAAIEKDYIRGVEEKARDYQRAYREVVPNTLTAKQLDPQVLQAEIIGRVAFDGPNEYLDGVQDFYIGSSKLQGTDYVVYSWAAPVTSSVFYRLPAQHEEHAKLAASVQGIRTFAHANGEISDFSDDVVGKARVELFRKRTLQVPKAPTSAKLPVSPPDERDAGATPSTQEQARKTASASPTDTPSKSMAAVADDPEIRAGELLVRQLAAPKRKSMSTVLATLQRDQLEIITQPGKRDQVIQGHPGTGKTIIAAHRAAYLLDVSSEVEDRPEGPIWIVGPTEEYSEHVLAALTKLIDDPRGYEVKSITSILDDLAQLPGTPEPTSARVYEDVSPDLARLIELAYKRAREESEPGERPDRATIYAEFIYLRHNPPEDGLDGDWVRYLKQLPQTYDDLRRQRTVRHRGLLAYIGVLAEPLRNGPGHIILDEAQDIHPIEWYVLGRLGNRGGWTILGDMNQRRSDHAHSSWDEAAVLLGVDDEERAPVRVLKRGYRSTEQIIRFANQLLPRDERTLNSLQRDGDTPKVVRVMSAGALITKAIDEAVELCDRVGEGLVAVITMDEQAVTKQLLKSGWKRDSDDSLEWHNDRHRFRVMPPDYARGLEFDGVVVVEPAAFPENAGRLGVLYTALTRANRFLTVVYNRALPRHLKAPK